MDDSTAPAEKRMRLRYAGMCRICGAALPAKTEAVYEGETKSVRCVTHDQHVSQPLVEVDIGEAGSSARREFERRKAGHEQRIRSSAVSSWPSATIRNQRQRGTQEPSAKNASVAN